MKTQVRFTVAALALALAAPALAQDDPAADPVLRMNDAVNTAALTRLGDLLPPGDVLRLFAVARQEALATSCDGYELDMARYTAVLNDILAGLREGTEPGAENLPVDVAMSAYSVVLGGQIAVGAFDQAAYCASGAEIRAELATDSEGRIGVLAPAN